MMNWTQPRSAFTVIAQIHMTEGRRYKPFNGYRHINRAMRSLELDFVELARYLGDNMGRDPKSKKEKYQFQFRGFVDVKLSDVQRDAFSSWDVHDEELYEIVATVVQGGFKLSTTYNSGNDTFTATLTGQNGTGDADGYSMSSFAPDWYNALRLLVFKHTVILEGDWARAAQAESAKWG